MEDQASEDLVGSERESVQEMLDGQNIEGESDLQLSRAVITRSIREGVNLSAEERWRCR